MGSRSLATTLKRKVNEMKQHKEEKSSMTNVDKVTGHVEGLVMQMERMLTSGDDLNKVREMRFRESLETSYQSPGKRRKLHDRQEAVQPMPRSRASPATRSRQTWPARTGLPSLTSKSPPACVGRAQEHLHQLCRHLHHGQGGDSGGHAQHCQAH